MTVLSRAVVTAVTVATGLVLVSSTASADAKSDCSEARSFLRSDGARRSCSARYHSARNLFCSTGSGQRLLLSMARSCKARAAAAPAAPADNDSKAKKAPEKGEKAAESTPATGVDNIPVCKAYFARVLACPPAKGPVSRQEEVNIKRRELQQKLDKGSKAEIVGGACSAMDKVTKC